MNILIVGAGGREHSLAISLVKSPKCDHLFFAPGNAGTAELGKNLSISDSDIPALISAAKEWSVDLTIVGPEAPLVAGIVDAFNAEGLAIIGPSKQGAQLEGSKDWAKAFMKRCHIPTAAYETFTDYDSSVSYLKEKNTYPIVIKADGLAAGKGVTVATDFEMAETALKDCFLDHKFADAGAKVVIEDFLVGEEASIFAFTDGKCIKPMTPAQDHKAVFDGDKGPNTGGMGAYSPTPLVTKEIEKTVYETVFLPLLKGFQDEGIAYKGIVYAGLMIDKGDVSIVEFNVRFGDPETQVVLPRLKTDLLDVFQAIVDERLGDLTLDWSDEAAVCVVHASGGYPDSYKTGFPISGLGLDTENAYVVHAGTKADSGNVLTNGGRVLGIVAKDSDLKTAITHAYELSDKVSFDGKYNRTDIGFKAFRN